MTLIGSVVERTPDNSDLTTSMTPFPVSADLRTGFPAVAHRSQRQRKSAFRQGMESPRPINRDAPIPLVQLASGISSHKSPDANDADWRSAMEAENAGRIALMTPEEREEELRLLRSKFGDNADLADVLRRAKDPKPNSGKKGSIFPTIEGISDEDCPRVPTVQPPSPTVHNPHHRVATPQRPVLSRRSSASGSSRPTASIPGTPSVRFAEVTSRDVFTYPSVSTSPKRAPLMIEAPPAEGSGGGVTKLQWQGKLLDTSEPPKAVRSESQPDLMGAPDSQASKSSQEQAIHLPSHVVSSSSPGSTPPELKVATNLPLADVSGTKTQLNDPAAGAPVGGIAFPVLSPVDDPITPEAIRRQYFPNEPHNNPSLEWIADLPEIPDTPITSEYAYIDGMGEKARFNLAGTPIPQDLAKEMPVHDGLHHNARNNAGKSESAWVWACRAGVGAVCVGVAAAVSLKAAL